MQPMWAALAASLQGQTFFCCSCCCCCCSCCCCYFNCCCCYFNCCCCCYCCCCCSRCGCCCSRCGSCCSHCCCWYFHSSGCCTHCCLCCCCCSWFCYFALVVAIAVLVLDVVASVLVSCRNKLLATSTSTTTDSCSQNLSHRRQNFQSNKKYTLPPCSILGMWSGSRDTSCNGLANKKNFQKAHHYLILRSTKLWYFLGRTYGTL